MLNGIFDASGGTSASRSEREGCGESGELDQSFPSVAMQAIMANLAKNIYELANDIVLPPVDQYWDLLEFAAKDGMRA